MKLWHALVLTAVLGVSMNAVAADAVSPAASPAAKVAETTTTPAPAAPAEGKGIAVNGLIDWCADKGGVWGVHEEKNIARCKLPDEDTRKAACEAKGGKFNGIYFSICDRSTNDDCDLPTKDAGKFCTDKAQCEDECVWNEATHKGQCTSWKGPRLPAQVLRKGKKQLPQNCL
ncbi:MAG: hypothetical protein ACOYNL_03870 [Rickettsiales bacterium]